MRRGKKLSKSGKKELIRRLVAQVKDSVPHAQRGIFVQIAGDLKTKYPVTFVSELREGKVNKKSLCFQMQTKFDNSNRASRKTTTEAEAPNIKAAFGCKKWRVRALPDGHTIATLEELRMPMQNHYEDTRPQAWNMEEVENAMELTYGILRTELNKQAEVLLKAQKKQQKKKQNSHEEEAQEDDPITTTEEIRNRWPFLFLPAGMMNHFTTLTEVNFREKLDEFLSGSAHKMLDFLLSTTKGKIKKIKKQHKQEMERVQDRSKSPELVTILRLLTVRFKEDLNYLWKIVPVSGFKQLFTMS